MDESKVRSLIRKRHLIRVFFFLLFSVFFVSQAMAGISLDENMRMGMPFGGAEDTGLDECPQGVSVIRMFMTAWYENDYDKMYALLDEESKREYSFEQARFDFQFLEFKEYRISSVRKDGENFEFILSHGDWKDGNKDIKKMIISGRTFKIIMPTRNSPFKESIVNRL